MTQFTPNGYLIQDMDSPTSYVKTLPYFGINSYKNFPLSYINDKVCQELTDLQSTKTDANGYHQFLEFISQKSLYEDYIKCCFEKGVNVRVLFLESTYKNEVFLDELPKMSFLGYECCPIPLDEQIITDIELFEPLKIHKNKLNEYGLFNALDDIVLFKKEYEKFVSKELVGDGLEYPFIFKVYEINTKN